MTIRKTIFALTAFAMLPLSETTALAAGSDHSTLGECYDYAIAQCTDPNDYDACIEFGLDDCDGSYNLSEIGLSARQAARLRLKKHLTVLKIRDRISARAE